ncbi:hypothetical protein G9A89_019980 [Geosiphon pyriformis]|nr:hypothetical protein G9A89_019980 [Geosiphon pyriformis]
MAYAPIAKLDNFTSEEDNTQIWLNNIEKAIVAYGWNDSRVLQAIFYFLKDIANLWYQSLAAKPQTFNEFKTEFLRYFSNNNSINYLTNTFTTIKQGDTEAVTTYLGCFHRNLHQIQAIQADYFTVPQILNQFIRGLCSSQQRNLGTGSTQNPNSQNYLSLLVTPEDATTNNLEFNPLQTTLTNNIPPAMVTENESLTAIFPFKLEETINSPLFSGAALKEKSITAMYTDAKVDADGVTKTPIGEINNFSIEVNGIILPIKVLVMEATQYQALVGNDWLSKTNTTLD